MSEISAVAHGQALRFAVRVQPRASRSECTGAHNGALRLRVQAPPVDGAANEAVVKLLADLLHVPVRHVRIVAGLSARLKTVEVDGVAREALDRLAISSSSSHS